MTAIEFIVPGTDREPNAAAAKKFLTESLERGMLMYPCGLYGQVVRIAPPLTVTRKQIDEAINIANQSLNAV